VTLPIPQEWLEPLAVGLDEVEDAAGEFGPRVQIVSRLPDQNLWLTGMLNTPIIDPDSY
jgi:hypothetical protein